MKLEEARDKLIQEFRWDILLKYHIKYSDILRKMKDEAIQSLDYLINSKQQNDWIISKHFVAFKMHDYLHLSFHVTETTIDIIDDEFVPIGELNKR